MICCVCFIMVFGMLMVCFWVSVVMVCVVWWCGCIGLVC